MKTKSFAAERRHEEFRLALIAVLKEHGKELTAEEMLAIASQLVGNLLAMQDLRRFTPSAAMMIVSQNIEIGNRRFLEAFAAAPGGQA